MRIFRAKERRELTSFERLNNAALDLAMLRAARGPMDYTIAPSFTFVNGTTADANQVNTDLGTLFSWANGGVDDANVNHAVGFYAASIIPTTAAQATFGGAASIGYSFKQPINMGQSFLRNKLRNGGMWIDQHNVGGVITPVNGQYVADGWNAGITQAGKFSTQQIAVAAAAGGPPSAFALRATSLGAYPVIAGDLFNFAQPVEGFNAQEFLWGTAAALPVVVSFWARASVAGNYGVAIRNAALTRSYVTNVTLVAGFQLVTVQIPGDQGGVWNLTGTSTALFVSLCLGCGATFQTPGGVWTAGNFAAATGATNALGTNGATVDFTAAQLETGNNYTGFEERLLGLELALCQRYCFVQNLGTSSSPVGAAYAISATQAFAIVQFPQIMRSSPSLTFVGTAANLEFNSVGTVFLNTAPTLQFASPVSALLAMTAAGGMTAGSGGALLSTITNASFIYSSEL